MQETAEQYKKRLFGYMEGKDPLRLLESAPKKMAKLVRGKSKKQLSRRPGPDKWSPVEILAHLADAEIAIAWRLRQILSNNGIAIQSFDQDKWAAAGDYAHRDPKMSLATYAFVRASNVLWMNSVPRAQWDNCGLHDQRGKESALDMMRLAAGHDINHYRQVESALKAKR